MKQTVHLQCKQITHLQIIYKVMSVGYDYCSYQVAKRLELHHMWEFQVENMTLYFLKNT